MTLKQRHSFSSSAVIQDDKGRYLLLVSKNALTRGEVLLMPVSGKIAIDPVETRLFAGHGAVFSKIGPPMIDLVFRAPVSSADGLRELFATGYAGRNATILREMREELVHETRTLRQKHLAGMTAKFSHIGSEQAPSKRADGEETLRLMSFFDVTLSTEAMDRLSRRAQGRPLYERIASRLRSQYTGPYVYFADADEINAGRTYPEEAEIAAITRQMLVK